MSRLERWSRLKRGNKGEQLDTDEVVLSSEDELLAQESSTDPGAAADTGGSLPPGTTPEPGSLDPSPPDPEPLPPGSDIKPLPEPGLSRGPRRRALRRLLPRDNYGLSDGPDDYDHDYREKLKPLASELAQRLRQWSKPVEDKPVDEETADDGVSEALPSPEHAQTPAPSAHAASPDEPPEAAAGGAVTEPDEFTLDQGRVGKHRQNSQE
jgi:hypothetical protein